ncbi:MAG: DNA mismatch repair endonuclease MutL [Gammaproteobacteria bacterium]|nr:DNA mismatch repair endonuclease MutL [Gammaproteobacteria bacterium]
MSDSNRIHALPLHLANQIAAGEVIERPASVVKELVENSIDAGATQIDIDIEGAGNQLIRVRDNGKGIHRDDLSLALSRHATSKLHSSEQLSHISSLGFRGEALPSITSISRLTITSRQVDSECAWQIIGDSTEPSPAAGLDGTTLEIRDLFFNLPARRHFLRSNKTEQHHILTTLQRLALSQFNVGFQCKLSASSQLKLPIASSPEQQQQRIAKICGKTFITNSIYLQQDYNDITLHGWIANAEAHRSQTDVQHFFINGRVIRDRVINHAIRQAYGNQIPAGRQAAYVLYLTMPLDRVDINVHPTKHEVRFRDARLVHGLITTALQEALSQSNTKLETVTPAISDNIEQPHIAESSASPYQSPPKTVPSTPQSEKITSTFGQATSLLHQRYVVTLTSDIPLLLDLQQAEQALKGQQLQDAIETDTLRSRPILVPIKLIAEAALVHAAESHIDTLNKYGVHVVATTDGLMIKSIPSLLAQADIKQLVQDLIDSIVEDSSNTTQLNHILQKHLPAIHISGLTHAQQVIDQLTDFPLNVNWCKPLDQQTLIGLFWD